ncbi:retrovirus-related pol polyprotein from transposon TNT 1-94 [Tanacetum coccineum]
MINLLQFLVMEIWFKEISRSTGFITLKVSITISSRLVNFYDADLDVAFQKSTCFVRDLQGNDLLVGNRGSDLYTNSLQETSTSTSICLMAKVSPTQAWLWHRRLSHLNFDYINLLSKKEVVIGLPKLKYVKDRRIGMKAVKEKEQLQKTVDSWKDSSKNLCKLVNSGMSSNSKVGLGYGIKSNNEVLSYEEEMNRTVFNCTKEDFVEKPLYNRFSKTDNLIGVPHPLTGDYNPKPQQEINESFKNPSEHSSEFKSESISVPKEMYASKSVTTNEKVVSKTKPKDVEPSYVTYVKTPRQPMKNQETPKVDRKN